MKRIRDALFGYIPISELEKEILKQPEVLRLHRVLQNSTLYQTYPSNRGSRFSHSLGAMHVSGELLRSLLNNSHPEYLHHLRSTLKRFLNTLSKSPSDKWLEQSHEYLNQQDCDEFYRIHAYSIDNRKPYADDQQVRQSSYMVEGTLNSIMFQAIRLAAMTHDLGHPPYSHVVEYGIRDVQEDLDENPEVDSLFNDLSMEYQGAMTKWTEIKMTFEGASIHEMVGIVLLSKIFQRISANETNRHAFYSVCVSTALKILTVDQLGHFNSDKFKLHTKDNEDKDIFVWYCLGSLISGPVDCDRLDYLRRDALNSGIMDSASFDYERIIQNVVIINPSHSDYYVDANPYLLVPGFNRRALSALEAFFHERMRQYRWLTGHHNVVRTDLCMSRLIYEIGHVLFSGESPLRDKDNQLLAKAIQRRGLRRLWSWKNIESDYRFIDDSWFDNALHGLYSDIRDINGRPNSHIEKCKKYLRAIFERDTKSLSALWKRVEGMVEFAESFCLELSNFLEEGGTPPPFLQKSITAGLKERLSRAEESEAISGLNYVLKNWRTRYRFSDFGVMRPLEAYIEKEMGTEFYFVFKSKLTYENVPIFIESIEDSYSQAPSMLIKDLEQLSGLVINLNRIAESELKLYGFTDIESRISLNYQKLGQIFAHAILNV